MDSSAQEDFETDCSASGFDTDYSPVDFDMDYSAEVEVAYTDCCTVACMDFVSDCCTAVSAADKEDTL